MAYSLRHIISAISPTEKPSIAYFKISISLGLNIGLELKLFDLDNKF